MGRRAPSLLHSRPQPSTPHPLTGPLLGGVRLSRGVRRSHTQGGVELASGFEPGFRAAPFDATPTSDLGVPRVSADPALPRPAQCPWWPPTARTCKPAPPPGPPRGPAPHGPTGPACRALTGKARELCLRRKRSEAAKSQQRRRIEGGLAGRLLEGKQRESCQQACVCRVPGREEAAVPSGQSRGTEPRPAGRGPRDVSRKETPGVLGALAFTFSHREIVNQTRHPSSLQ